MADGNELLDNFWTWFEQKQSIWCVSPLEA